MAKRKPRAHEIKELSLPPIRAEGWQYTGPPYRRVKIEGIPVFDPATITQVRIGILVSRYPEKLANYFAQVRRVKPGIDVAAEEE